MTSVPQLDPSERLTWSGEPHPWRYATRRSAGNIVLGVIIMLVGAGLWKALDTGNTANNGIFFGFVTMMAIGIIIVAGSPLWYLWRATHTRYALTDRRAIIETGPPFSRRVTVFLHDIPFVALRNSRAGFGDVIFKETAVDQGAGRPAAIAREGFIAVADAGRVECLVRDAAAAASARIRAST